MSRQSRTRSRRGRYSAHYSDSEEEQFHSPEQGESSLDSAQEELEVEGIVTEGVDAGLSASLVPSYRGRSPDRGPDWNNWYSQLPGQPEGPSSQPFPSFFGPPFEPPRTPSPFAFAPAAAAMAAVVQEPKEKGRRPDPFTDKSQYPKFRRQISTFFASNTEIYDNDVKKVLFVLSFMTDGAPGQWAEQKVEAAERTAVAGVIPDASWGTWDQLRTALDASFGDPNKSKNAQNELETLTYRSPADEFFQLFDTLVGRTNYANNDEYRIDFIERKLPRYILDMVYQDDPPNTYDAYKTKVIRLDNLRRRLKAIHTGQTYTRTSSSTPAHTQDRRTGTGVVYGGQGKPMDIGRNRPKGKIWEPQYKQPQKSTQPQATSSRNPPRQPIGAIAGIECYNCGQKGHMSKDCSRLKKKRETLRAFVETLDDYDKDLLQGFLNV